MKWQKTILAVDSLRSRCACACACACFWDGTADMNEAMSAKGRIKVCRCIIETELGVSLLMSGVRNKRPLEHMNMLDHCLEEDA